VCFILFKQELHTRTVQSCGVHPDLWGAFQIIVNSCFWWRKKKKCHSDCPGQNIIIFSPLTNLLIVCYY
jgi:hypothetical protein